MSDIFLGIITFVVIVVAIVLVRVLMELRDGLKTVRESAQKTEDLLAPVLQDLQASLQSLRQTTDDVDAVVEDVRVLSGSMRQFGENVKRISDMVEIVSESAVVNVTGLRVAVKAASTYLLKNFLKKKKTY